MIVTAKKQVRRSNISMNVSKKFKPSVRISKFRYPPFNQMDRLLLGYLKDSATAIIPDLVSSYALVQSAAAEKG